MNHYIVSCEFKGNRRDTVEVPVSVPTLIMNEVDVSSMTACCRAERIASEQFGDTLNQWFAWEVEPDNE